MKIVFRVNYRTVPGQLLALKMAAVEQDGTRVEREVPMYWRDEWHWEAVMETAGPLRVEYSYVFRDAADGVVLEEWHAPRVRDLVDGPEITHLLLDDWCSAGGVDAAYESKVFPVGEKTYAAFPTKAGANHTFRLRMARVPAGVSPCVTGGVDELGAWRETGALPLVETAENLWEAAVYLPVDWHVEYKYALRCNETGRFLGYEAGANRHLPPRRAGEETMVHVADGGFRREAAELFRGAGVAVPVFSLRSEEGMGTGEFADLKEFGDWAAAAGMKMIQILPINDTTSTHEWTDSYPYSAISVNALHPLYLRVSDLPYEMDRGYQAELRTVRQALNHLGPLDYEAVMAAKHRLARLVYAKHGAVLADAAGYKDFLAENDGWLPAYAAFCVLRDRFKTANFRQWQEWELYDEGSARRLAEEDGGYHMWLQYELDRQLTAAVKHLRGLGVALKGDLPIGIDRESADAWAQPHLFHMEAQAGAPPDAFAVKGQNWGFPTYDWEEMKRDGYAWWRGRFTRLSRYFDAFRIDHILGFFRIWQVAWEHVEGIMGWFDPAMAVHVDEICGRGIGFNFHRMCRPYIREWHLAERFGDLAETAVKEYLETDGWQCFRLADHVATQRAIMEHFAALPTGDAETVRKNAVLRDGLLDCAAEVLFLEAPKSHGTLFHPRCAMEGTKSFQELDDDQKWKVKDLSDDYFYRRQEGFWAARGYEKLPAMRHASDMLLCGEDLGMVPDCVPGVMRELGILSLEIQRMPKKTGDAYSDPRNAPYLAVVSPGTHDMATLRGWWREDHAAASHFAWHALGIAFPEADLPGDTAAVIIAQHLESPAMWAVFPIQDLLAMDEELRHPDVDSERINVPAIIPYYWRYRLHLTTAELAGAARFNERIRTMIAAAGR